MKALTDSGSFGNYISALACTTWGVVPMLDEGNEEEVALANGAKLHLEGHVQF